jgi:putative membrane protein
MMGWGYPWSGAMMAGMAVWGLIWLIIVGLVIWAVVRWLDRRIAAPSPTSGPSALEPLRQRYARGEIDAATFEVMRERLEASTTRDATPTGRA